MKRIVFIGPESSGKTFAVNYCSTKFGLTAVPEYLREFWDEHGAVEEEEMASIARRQLENEDVLGKPPVALLDTNLITLKVYHQWYFKHEPTWFKELFNADDYHHYLLFQPDIPWVDDGQRDAENERKQLFELFENELKNLDAPYTIISGDFDERLRLCEEIISAQMA